MNPSRSGIQVWLAAFFLLCAACKIVPAQDLTITVSKNGDDYTIDWNDMLGENALLHGAYFVYRSDNPVFTPGDKINIGPIHTCAPRPTCATTQHRFVDSAPPCTDCYYAVWNQLLGGLPNATSPIGMNIMDVTYYSREWPFADLMKSGRPWVVQTATQFDTGEENIPGYLDPYLDPDGWPTALPPNRFLATLMGAPGSQHPSGQYNVWYEGEGNIVYLGLPPGSLARSPGHDVITFTAPMTGFVLRIAQTDPNHTGNYLRNIRVLMPGTTDGQIFHPRFLEDLQSYKLIRYMHFLNTITSVTTTWDTRTHNRPQWNGVNGAPPEAAIDLSIALNADAWLPMPTRATDDYVQSFAQMAHDRLAGTNLKVYMEYSNEIWNGAYPYSINGTYVEQQGIAQWPDPNISNFVKRANQFAKRTVEMCAIWKSIWGADSSRVKCVMGGWTGNGNNWNNLTLNCALFAADRGGRTCDQDVDYLATAPYVGGYIGNEIFQSQVENWNPDTLFQEMQYGGVLYDPDCVGWQCAPQDGALAESFRNMEEDIAVAQAHNLPLVAYEGGEELVGRGSAESNPQIIALFANANRDPRMGQLMSLYLAGWLERGGGVFAYFRSVAPYGQFGNSGTKEFQDQTDAAKYNAIQDFIFTHPVLP